MSLPLPSRRQSSSFFALPLIRYVFPAAPRLRLTARLAAAAPAPLLSRSQSTNAIVQSNGSNDIGSHGIAASPVNGSGGQPLLPGTSLPALSSLQSTLARRSSVSASPSQSLPSRGLPSLEAIEKRFAQKKEKEKDKDASSSSSSSTAGKAAATASSTGHSQSAAIVKVEPATPSDAIKENIDPKTGLDASHRHNVTRVEPASVAMSKAGSSTSSIGSSNSPTTPTDVTMPLGGKGTVSQSEHPLQHKWTLYYDSRNSTRVPPASNPATPTSVGHPNGIITTGKQQYEAGLSTLATVDTVENFCRLYNWLKKPSKLGLNENMHLFKENIMPMWEDENNKKGGKWTVCLDPKILNVRDLLDKLWMYLCFALVSERSDSAHSCLCYLSFDTHFV